MSDAFILLTDDSGEDVYINTRNINYVRIWPEGRNNMFGMVYLRKARPGQTCSFDIEKADDLPAIRAAIETHLTETLARLRGFESGVEWLGIVDEQAQ